MFVSPVILPTLVHPLTFFFFSDYLKSQEDYFTCLVQTMKKSDHMKVRQRLQIHGFISVCTHGTLIPDYQSFFL